MDATDHFSGRRHIVGDAEFLIPVQKAGQMVRRQRPLSLSGLGGSRLQPPVDLHGVTGDHLSVQRVGQGRA